MPIMGRNLDWTLDPLEALARWPLDRRVLLLHSGRYEPRWSRYSIMAEPVGSYRFTRDGHSVLHAVSPSTNGAGETILDKQLTHDPFQDLRSLLQLDGLWIGYLGYDLGRWIENLPSLAAADRDWPVIELGHCPGWLVHDRADGQWRACGTWSDNTDHPWVQLPVLPPQSPIAYRAAEPRSVFAPADYRSAVQRVIDYIAAGDVFQVNLAQRFSAKLAADSASYRRSLFARLATVSPAWFGAYLEADGAIGDDGGHVQRAIASTSPELFLDVDTQGHVITRPIKGTRPATVPAETLRQSAKDLAELNMIVDLMRNDLGRVCRYGSVRVERPRDIESHPTVHHGVATITGELATGRDVVDLIRATMPGGSITGAPKVRAMQIIDELEHVRRGPYCGCIGYLSRHHTCLNIAIRTMLLESRRAPTAHQPDAVTGRVDFHVGGGIVADSDPAMEYQETLDKAAAIMAALGNS
ncbi:MAG: anthranilate synthase component I family protein [Phycisphaeraceae bacterium]